LAFRSLVRQVFPDEAAGILAAHQPSGPGVDQETARVWAFCQKVESELFPIYEAEEYEQIVCCIPFVRFGWSYDSFHDLERPPGHLLLMVLCAQPYSDELDARVPLLEAAANLGVGPESLAELRDCGVAPDELHKRLDGTPFQAAADFADWAWGQTGSAFLDLDDETEIGEVAWTPESVHDLAEQWHQTQAILERIDRLAAWLAAEPGPRFAALVDVALGHPAHLCYERERRLYACEITEAGIVGVPDRGPDDFPVPAGLAA
jgi:hypothetical protein